MDTISLFSALSFVSVIIYMQVGIYAYSQNRKSLVHIAFLLLCTCYAVWSFAYAFAYVAVDPQAFSFWNKISAVGWCSFSPITLYLVTLITENKLSGNRLIKGLMFLPAIIFFCMAVFLFGPDIKTPDHISRVFYVGNFWYNFILLSLSMILIFRWGRKSPGIRTKKQAKILVVCSIIPFGLNLISQTILPMLGVQSLPLMGQLYAVIMIMGIYHVISKYSFLKVPEKVLLEEIQDKIFEMVIILDSQYRMIKISKQALSLLDYEERDLMNKSIEYLFDEEPLEQYRSNENKDEEIRFEDIVVKGRNDIKIPANIYFIPIFDENVHEFLGALLIMQDIRIQYELKMKNELLYEKTIRDSLTNLYNYQYMIEITKEHIAKRNKDDDESVFALMMIDLDYFKKVNDTFGHLFGDYVLRTVSEILTGIILDDGYVGRYGGEEFIILLPDYNIEKAYAVGERIRETIEEYRFDQDLNITISVGIKQYSGEAYDQLINSADVRLYQAKQNGRNQTAI